LTGNIYQCTPFAESCLELNNETYYDICEVGYVGPLCQTCNHNFSKYGGKECVACYSKENNYILLVAILIGFMLILSVYIKYFFFKFDLICFIIRLNYNNIMNLKDKNFAIKKMILGAYFKIFVNYSQTIAIINTLHLNWNQKLYDMFNLMKIVSGGVQQIIAVECLTTGFIFSCYKNFFLC